MKLLAKDVDAQEAAPVCVHYYLLTLYPDRRLTNKKPTAEAVGSQSSRRTESRMRSESERGLHVSALDVIT